MVSCIDGGTLACDCAEQTLCSGDCRKTPRKDGCGCTGECGATLEICEALWHCAPLIGVLHADVVIALAKRLCADKRYISNWQREASTPSQTPNQVQGKNTERVGPPCQAVVRVCSPSPSETKRTRVLDQYGAVLPWMSFSSELMARSLARSPTNTGSSETTSTTSSTCPSTTSSTFPSTAAQAVSPDSSAVAGACIVTLGFALALRTEPHKLVYSHHHHPGWLNPTGAPCGLDCSNFSAYLYNTVMGVAIPSHIGKQSSMCLPRVTRFCELQAGDLAYFTRERDRGHGQVSHCGIIVVNTPTAACPSPWPPLRGVLHCTASKTSFARLPRRTNDVSTGNREITGTQTQGPRNCGDRLRESTAPQLTVEEAQGHKPRWPLNSFAHGFRLHDVLCAFRDGSLPAVWRAVH